MKDLGQWQLGRELDVWQYPPLRHEQVESSCVKAKERDRSKKGINGPMRIGNNFIIGR